MGQGAADDNRQMRLPAAAEPFVAALRAVVDPIAAAPAATAAAPHSEALTPAAVLVPVVLAEAGPELLFTVRNSRLRRHPGQISFPGGRVDPDDRDPGHTALREAEEELGIHPEDIALVGCLDTCITGTGYSVVPVVGLLRSGYPYRPSAEEVEEIFHAPVAHLLDAGNHQRGQREINGAQRSYYEIWYRDFRIWGATAQMIVGLHRRLAAAEGAGSAVRQLHPG